MLFEGQRIHYWLFIKYNFRTSKVEFSNLFSPAEFGFFFYEIRFFHLYIFFTLMTISTEVCKVCDRYQINIKHFLCVLYTNF